MANSNRQRISNGDDWDFDDEDEDFGEGPTFRLGGEEFRCVPMPAGGTLTRLAASLGRDERGRQVYNLPDMNMFIEDCLIEETVESVPGTPDPEHPEAEVPDVVVTEPADDVERWRVLMADKKRPIRVAKIAAIVVRLSDHYSEDRPTRPSRR